MSNNQQLAMLKQLGITVNDQAYFDQQIRDNGFGEIVCQYLPHFVIDPTAQPLVLIRPTDFQDIDDLYLLDQRLKNVTMVGLQGFEQSFKVALARTIEQTASKSSEIFKAAYQLADGHTIRRGDLKARLRHIKRHYLEPYPGFDQAHGGQITPWVLVKEMSFGVATNAFFLLGQPKQAAILDQVFKGQVTLAQCEHLLANIRTIRGRAAHNYRLIGIKVDGTPVYRLVLTVLAALTNHEPYQRTKKQLGQLSSKYLLKHPREKKFLKAQLGLLMDH